MFRRGKWRNAAAWNILNLRPFWRRSPSKRPNTQRDIINRSIRILITHCCVLWVLIYALCTPLASTGRGDKTVGEPHRVWRRRQSNSFPIEHWTGICTGWDSASSNRVLWIIPMGAINSLPLFLLSKIRRSKGSSKQQIELPSSSPPPPDAIINNRPALWLNDS